uniref:Large ribosomal subunit protein bL33c n=1 Tax=Lygodium japonicum TaxID=13824 RepID=S4UES0_LYGJA|nr:ribosomal protein L33 [Lygodium japonicum]AGI51434.1 ribosomal protein L33 [Lygodium japonicum]AHA59640.1 ribosomal protein L33 [Lygodium japonicum]
MTKSKDARVTITLECTACVRRGANQKYPGISRYTTRKNRRNMPTRLELRKYRPCCYEHTIYKELKK